MLMKKFLAVTGQEGIVKFHGVINGWTQWLKKIKTIKEQKESGEYQNKKEVEKAKKEEEIKDFEKKVQESKTNKLNEMPEDQIDGAGRETQDVKQSNVSETEPEVGPAFLFLNASKKSFSSLELNRLSSLFVAFLSLNECLLSLPLCSASFSFGAVVTNIFDKVDSLVNSSSPGIKLYRVEVKSAQVIIKLFPISCEPTTKPLKIL